MSAPTATSRRRASWTRNLRRLRDHYDQRRADETLTERQREMWQQDWLAVSWSLAIIETLKKRGVWDDIERAAALVDFEELA